MRPLRFAMLVGLVFVGRASAQTAEEILKMTDHAFTNFSDLTVDSKMTIYEPGATTGREVMLSTVRKGEKQVVRFTAPADVRGMALLTENRDTMYALLPAFGNRIRRMGMHAKGQSFMGSDVRNEDIASTSYTGYWAPKLVGTDDTSWILELTLLPGKEYEFKKQKIWVDKNHHQVNKTEFFGDDGKVAFTAILTNYKLDDGTALGPTAHYSPQKVEYIDHRRNDHRTTIEMVKVKCNTGISDDVFTQRSLLRGQ
jgi:outer membrane lipoprotein-sorting protein